MIGEAIVAGAVATVIGMLRVDAARYVFWHNHVAKRWFVPIIVIQALAFAGSGVAAWALAHLLGVEGVEDKWLLNGCIFGVAGYLLLGFQLDALDVDKLRSPYVPLKFIAEFGRKLLDALALNQIESLPDAELAERAWLLFWDKMYPDASIAATVKETQRTQLTEAAAQILAEQTRPEGRARFRTFVRAYERRV